MHWNNEFEWSNERLFAQVFVDMTFGAGGHTRALLKQGSDTHVYTLDRDSAAYILAQRMAEKYK